MEVCSGSEAVTLLRYGPRTPRTVPPRGCSNKKSDKFSFKFRRRSKSAPRNKPKDRELTAITYTANGEKLRNPDSPFKPDTVELVGFTTYSQVPSSESGDTSTCHSLDSSDTGHVGSLDHQYKALSDSRTLSRTSKDIKMERERLRQEKMNNKNWQGQRDWYETKKPDKSEPLAFPSENNKISSARILLNSNLAEERAKFFDEARERFHNANNDLFSQFLKEREERFSRLAAGLGQPGQSAFSTTGDRTHSAQLYPGVRNNNYSSATLPKSETFPGHRSTSESVLGPNQSDDNDSANILTDINSDNSMSESKVAQRHQPLCRNNAEERVIPISINTEEVSAPISKEAEPSKETGRIIPVMVESSGSSTSSTSTTPCQNSPDKNNTTIDGGISSGLPPSFPSLIADMKLADSVLKPGRTSFHHPSFANHFGFARIGNGFRSDDKSLLAAGLRDSFPGFPNFGNFPSFTPLLSGERPSIASGSRYRDKSKADSIHKQRLGKSKSSVEYSANKQGEPFRYVNDSEALEPYGDSESESEDDDLDSVSVIADRTRDRLSGTGSTHSHESSTHSHDGSTHSHDSGIPEEEPRIRIKYENNKPRRPDSAVPSEYSVVSDSSSCEGSDDKIFSVDARPLVVPKQNIVNASIEKNILQTDEYKNRTNKSYVIASELLKTEVHYVAILHLIDQVFHFRVDRENRANHMFPQEMVTTIFSNIKSVYKFHAEFLLPQLKERMEKWHDGVEFQRIGDIMVKNAPFLKMYTEYVKNFDTAMNTINTLYAKNSKFAAIVEEIHSMVECESLTLQHHMLSPIQRIPRYEMLLKDYIQKLPEDSPDRQDSESALLQVSQAAAHANDSMKRIEQFKKLLEVQESIGGGIDLVSPTREVIKEGRMVKISARTGDHQDRYLFLLSDLLLLCSPRKSMISGPQFGLRARFEVDNMQVLEGDNLVTANTFYVRDDHKSVELYTATRQEKEEWLEYLFLAIKSLYTRKSSLRVGREILRPLDSEIGKKQPHMQKLENVQKCTDCATQFSILKHKHNCRFCGAVFCSKCSEYRHPLPWEDGRKARICRACYHVLTSQGPSQPINELPVRPKGLLEVPASSPSVHSGWLVLRPPGSKSSSNKRFFLLLPDFVLYSFRSEVDPCALTATPVPGFSILTGSQLKGDSGCSEKDRDKVIKMYHPPSKRTYYFAGTSAPDVERWAEALQMASRAEIPVGSRDLALHSDNQSTSSTEYENG